MQRKKRSAPASRVPDDDLSDVENEGRRMDPPRDGAAADDGGGGVRAGRGVRRSSPRRVLRGRGCPPGRNRSSPAESVYQRRSERLAHVREAEGVRKYREQSANAFFHDGGGTGGAGGAGGGDGGNDSIGVHLEDLVNECVDESGVLRRTFVRAITAEDAMSERAIRVQKQEEKMLEQFKKAKSGEVTVVLVGEAGQGKSYLMNVFLRMADSGAGALIRHGMTSGRGLTPFVVYVHVNPLDDPTPQGISIDLFEGDAPEFGECPNIADKPFEDSVPVAAEVLDRLGRDDVKAVRHIRAVHIRLRCPGCKNPIVWVDTPGYPDPQMHGDEVAAEDRALLEGRRKLSINAAIRDADLVCVVTRNVDRPAMGEPHARLLKECGMFATRHSLESTPILALLGNADHSLASDAVCVSAFVASASGRPSCIEKSLDSLRRAFGLAGAGSGAGPTGAGIVAGAPATDSTAPGEDSTAKTSARVFERPPTYVPKRTAEAKATEVIPGVIDVEEWDKVFKSATAVLVSPDRSLGDYKWEAVLGSIIGRASEARRQCHLRSAAMHAEQVCAEYHAPPPKLQEGMVREFREKHFRSGKELDKAHEAVVEIVASFVRGDDEDEVTDLLSCIRSELTGCVEALSGTVRSHINPLLAKHDRDQVRQFASYMRDYFDSSLLVRTVEDALQSCSPFINALKTSRDDAAARDKLVNELGNIVNTLKRRVEVDLADVAEKTAALAADADAKIKDIRKQLRVVLDRLGNSRLQQTSLSLRRTFPPTHRYVHSQRGIQLPTGEPGGGTPSDRLVNAKSRRWIHGMSIREGYVCDQVFDDGVEKSGLRMELDTEGRDAGANTSAADVSVLVDYAATSVTAKATGAIVDGIVEYVGAMEEDKTKLRLVCVSCLPPEDDSAVWVSNLQAASFTRLSSGEFTCGRPERTALGRVAGEVDFMVLVFIPQSVLDDPRFRLSELRVSSPNLRFVSLAFTDGSEPQRWNRGRVLKVISLFCEALSVRQAFVVDDTLGSMYEWNALTRRHARDDFATARALFYTACVMEAEHWPTDDAHVNAREMQLQLMTLQHHELPGLARYWDGMSKCAYDLFKRINSRITGDAKRRDTAQSPQGLLDDISSLRGALRRQAEAVVAVDAMKEAVERMQEMGAVGYVAIPLGKGAPTSIAGYKRMEFKLRLEGLPTYTTSVKPRGGVVLYDFGTLRGIHAVSDSALFEEDRGVKELDHVHRVRLGYEKTDDLFVLRMLLHGVSGFQQFCFLGSCKSFDDDDDVWSVGDDGAAAPLGPEQRPRRRSVDGDAARSTPHARPKKRQRRR